MSTLPMCQTSPRHFGEFSSHLMMPVKLSLKGWVFMHNRLAEARRGLTLVILAMTIFPGSGVLILASPRSTSTTGFCMDEAADDTPYKI